MAQTNLLGKIILGYQVTELLGSGTFGTVYKVVKNNESGQYVRALKHITIPTEKQYTSVFNSMGGDISKVDNYFYEMLKNIVSEIKILNDLSEKGIQHIVRYYENDIVTTDSPKRYDIYILMEYLTPLSDYISDNNFSVREVMKLGLDVLCGLESCHNNGVIHRDIKDDNIFVSAEGEYKIGDFGVSKVLKDSSKAESMKGTPNFLAPEVYLGKESYTKSVDLYSLGIVLYRLLNYNRNPFLPHYPHEFKPQDEDVAFEERMRGRSPDLPSLGGNTIGSVIVKAISSTDERYKTAEEFFYDLKYAIDKTSEEVLGEKVKFVPTIHSKTNYEIFHKEYAATIGETSPSGKFGSTMEDEHLSSANKHLFESVGETPSFKVPDIEPIVESVKTLGAKEFFTSESRRVVSMVPSIVEPETPVAVDKTVMDKVVFLVPIGILLIGIMAYFIVIPNTYRKVVSFIDWFFTDPQSIIDTLRDPNTMLPKVNSIIGTRIFWRIWLVGFIASLFFVGRQLHAKPEPNATNAILTRKEPYLMIQDVTVALKLIKQRRSDNELDILISSVKCLEEKLAVESDFGYGKGAIINCENNIATQLQFLVDSVSLIENDNFGENISKMSLAISNINSLLKRRIELKKQ